MTTRPARSMRAPALALTLRRQCIPGRERVHVVSPVHDLPVFNLDDGAEPIVVLDTGGKDRPVDFVLDDDDPCVVSPMNDQMVGRSKFDVVAIASELGHEVDASLHDSGPPGEVIQDLVDNVIRDDVEEVLAINKVT